MEIEGVVLSAIPFQESDTILTLFTPLALFKLFVKGRRRLDAHHQALISSFTVASYTYTSKNSDLHRFHEGKIVDQNLKLRDRLASFEAAQKILQTIYHTQWQNKETPALYLLTRKFLSLIPQMEDPRGMPAAFMIKLLKHEGILDPSAFGEQRRIQALASVKSVDMLTSLLPDEALAQEIESYYNNVI